MFRDFFLYIVPLYTCRTVNRVRFYLPLRSLFLVSNESSPSELCFFFTWYQSDDRTRPELSAGLFHLIAGKLVVLLPNPNRVFLFSLTALSLSRVQLVVSPSLALARSQSDGSPSAFLADWSTVE